MSNTGAIPFGIALGSNLGDREANLRRAVALLRERISQAQEWLIGDLYETDPVDCAPGTQAFLNTVLQVQARLSPEAMHAHLQFVEQALGRPVQRERNAPRTLDLDLLYAGDFVLSDPVLILPHPRLHLRRFVLQPLADIQPQLQLPGHTRSIAAHLAALEDDSSAVRRVGPWAQG